MQIEELYEYAESHNIDVDWFLLNKLEAFSLPFEDGTCAIAIDPSKLKSSADEKVKLGHELGHCETGSFYNRYSPYDVVARHERRADKWEIKKLVPKDELDAAVANGRTELWELAEFFGVTEDFIKKAVVFYQPY